MKNKKLSGFRYMAILLFGFVAQSVMAADYADLISEEYLRSQFEFTDGAKLKYSQCVKKSYPTCTYIWGVASKKDASRTKHGLAPEGSKLMIVYAQARSAGDFDRVTATYSDAEEIKDLGVMSVWSGKRKQLSFITDSHLVVHVNIEEENVSDSKRKAESIAKYLMQELSEKK